MDTHPQNTALDSYSSNRRTPAPLIDISHIRARLKELPGWQIENTYLVKSFHFEHAAEAMAFVVRVGEAADEHNHHPHVHWWKRDVRIELWTHKSNGLTTYDFEFAAHCDPLCEVTQ
ncbi:4a-hydroxytetrahydrobiopterin dehydratase [Hydrogenophaga sp.]|uniref:4a-hydroxytetrahydrobiopterin dehydratase n=1 Tax=Hydrogenophaga sp. TaxID=1904254 RepID=UPI002725ADBA|nr:4a-hydroxytetrahydrobiopterin dehydratase [Hydrogenophaga sp.]MDO9438837.1 4a-hydroxytetrahydrobiopterin dehydratase [Hydrogenophaga sp.]